MKIALSRECRDLLMRRPLKGTSAYEALANAVDAGITDEPGKMRVENFELLIDCTPEDGEVFIETARRYFPLNLSDVRVAVRNPLP